MTTTTTKPLTGPLYDYNHQRWVEVDTEFDIQTGPNHFVTEDDVPYETNEERTTYRNAIFAGPNPVVGDLMNVQLYGHINTIRITFVHGLGTYDVERLFDGNHFRLTGLLMNS